MRTLITVVVLTLAGTSWWVGQPESESDFEAALARASGGTSVGTTIASAEPAVVPTVEEDLAQLGHFAHNVDRRSLEALERRLARALGEDPERAELNLALCTSARLLGDAEAAVAFGERAIAQLPESSAAHLQHAKAIAGLMRVEGVFSAMKHLGAYKKMIARAVELDPGNVKARVERIGFLVFAPGLLGGDLEEAQRLAKELGPIDARYSALMQALALAQSEQMSEARSLCEATLADFPGDQALCITLAMMLREVGRDDEAAAHFDAVLSGPRTEKYYQALFHRAVLRIESAEEPDLALAAMTEYAEADPYGDFLPSVAAARWRQGQVLEWLRRPAEARIAYQTSLAEDPEFEQAEDALAALD